MYSHRFIKENLELLKTKLSLRGVSVDLVTEAHENVLKLQQLSQKERELNENRNKLINQDAKQNAPLIKEIKVQMADLKKQILEQEEITKRSIDFLPNIFDDSLLPTQELIRTWGNAEKKEGYLDHRELCKKLNLCSFEESISIAGSGFASYVGKGARLYRSLIEYTLKLNREKGYEERYLPVLLLEESLYGTAQLPKFEEDLFKTTDGRYLSPTSESQLVNIYRDQIIEEHRLPIKLTANTNCFRKEAGASGMEESGLIRLHQFCKTELVVMCKPEDSFNILEQMVKDACSILESLNLPHRVVQLAYDDIGFASAKTYDIEVWFPSEGRYREISSVSNTLDFQSRRAKIRYKKNLLDKNEKAQLLHLLNGSSLAIDRLFAAIVDNYQKSGDSIAIPEPLIEFLGFSEI